MQIRLTEENCLKTQEFRQCFTQISVFFYVKTPIIHNTANQNLFEIASKWKTKSYQHFYCFRWIHFKENYWYNAKEPEFIFTSESQGSIKSMKWFYFCFLFFSNLISECCCCCAILNQLYELVFMFIQNIKNSNLLQNYR